VKKEDAACNSLSAVEVKPPSIGRGDLTLAPQRGTFFSFLGVPSPFCNCVAGPLRRSRILFRERSRPSSTSLAVIGKSPSGVMRKIRAKRHILNSVPLRVPWLLSRVTNYLQQPADLCIRQQGAMFSPPGGKHWAGSIAFASRTVIRQGGDLPAFRVRPRRHRVVYPAFLDTPVQSLPAFVGAVATTSGRFHVTFLDRPADDNVLSETTWLNIVRLAVMRVRSPLSRRVSLCAPCGAYRISHPRRRSLRIVAHCHQAFMSFTLDLTTGK